MPLRKYHIIGIFVYFLIRCVGVVLFARRYDDEARMGGGEGVRGRKGRGGETR